MALIVPAIPFRQRKVKMYVAVVPVTHLDRFVVDTWDARQPPHKRGYQRKSDQKRVEKIARYLERADGIMPVAGLLNIRETGQLSFSRGELRIPDGTRVWIVDMQ